MAHVSQPGVLAPHRERQAKQKAGNRDLADGADVEQPVVGLGEWSQPEAAADDRPDADFEEHENIGEVKLEGDDPGMKRGEVFPHMGDSGEICRKPPSPLRAVDDLRHLGIESDAHGIHEVFVPREPDVEPADPSSRHSPDGFMQSTAQSSSQLGEIVAGPGGDNSDRWQLRHAGGEHAVDRLVQRSVAAQHQDPGDTFAHRLADHPNRLAWRASLNQASVAERRLNGARAGAVTFRPDRVRQQG